jgi:hypothetical protein
VQDPKFAFAESRNRHECRAIEADVHLEPAAWRINDWRRQVPMSRTKFYQERDAGRIETVKLGSATLVTTSPQDYIALLRVMAA